MPRPQRCRRICREPEYNRFSPEGIAKDSRVQLSIDEFEVIRLVDYEKKDPRAMRSPNGYFPYNGNGNLRIGAV